ncbi:LOW QUALITY PROTEIN: hypothetical protein V2J09_011803 [Rumex salicifolius]
MSDPPNGTDPWVDDSPESDLGSESEGVGSRIGKKGGPCLAEPPTLTLTKTLFATEGRVPVVLDGVVSPSTFEYLCNAGPPIPEFGVGLNDDVILLGGKRTVVDFWGELVEPTEPTRFSSSAMDGLADLSPIFAAMLPYQPH